MWEGGGLRPGFGGAQLGDEEDGREGQVPLHLFIVRSCATRANQAGRAIESPGTDSIPGFCNSKEKSNFFTYADTEWDAENNGFSQEPTLQRLDAMYGIADLESSGCFQITWEVERVSTQRTLSHVAMETEGIRTAKMEVQMPYFFAGPEIQHNLVELCSENVLESVIADVHAKRCTANRTVREE